MSKVAMEKSDLEERVLAAVRGTAGNQNVTAVTVERLDERNPLGRNWRIASTVPHIENQDASYRAFHAGSDLQDKYDLAE